MAGAAAVVAVVALSACGAKTGSDASSDAASRPTPPAHGQGRPAQLALRHHGDQRGDRPRLAEAGDRRDQRLRRSAGQEDQADQRGRRLRLADLRREGEKLIKEDKVAATFGCWTSASRKAMLPVFEKNKSLLFYPVQYEGLEESPVHLLHRRDHQPADRAGARLPEEQGKKKLYLVGSDYVFPRTANKIIKAYAKANGMKVVGEDYAPLGSTEFSTIVNKVKASGPTRCSTPSTATRNVAFFKEYKSAGLTAASMPVVSVSIAEEEVKSIGVAVPGRPVDGLELLPDDHGRGEHEVRRGVQGQVRRTSRPVTRWRPRTPRSTCGRRWSRRRSPSTRRR
jgi:urea transport system substrate-binding protein